MPVSKILISFGYPDTTSPRYRNLQHYFKEKGYTILECHTQAKGIRSKWKDLRKKYTNLAQEPHALWVTFPGHYLVPLAWLLAKKHKASVLFDAFISVSDSLVSDRKKISWLHPYAWLLYFVDVLSCHLADVILIDTKAHAAFFAKRFFINPKRIEVHYVGTRTDMFYPVQKQMHGKQVLFYGSYIPLQGIEHIIRAAKIVQVKDPEITFTLIGNGQTYKQIRALATKLCVSNCKFVDTVAYKELPTFVQQADLCLGIFGDTKKAARVIPHKVFDAVACNVPVITRDSPAIQELYATSSIVQTCAPANPENLAMCILGFFSNR